jgi:hypothetical protein
VRIRDWTAQNSEVVLELKRRVLSGEGSKWDSKAARVADALPVYTGVGSTLLISESGEILSYDDEQESVRPESDEVWRSIALVSAARRYPELRALLPARPEGAPECDQCAGTGSVKRFACGRCGGLGWLGPAGSPPGG